MLSKEEELILSPYTTVIDLNEDQAFIFNSLHGTYEIIAKEQVFGTKKYHLIPQLKNLLEKKLIMGENITETIHTNEVVPTAFILPTYDCNLQCSYCFQQMSKMQKQSMSDETLQLVIDNIQDNGYYIHPIYLFGGEPLMKKNRKFIESFLFSIKENNWKFAIFTNGTSIRWYLSLLMDYKEYCDHIHVTLDGGEETHNKRRGENTYKTIIENIKELLNKEIKVKIRVNIDSETVETLSDLLKDFELFLKDPYLEIYCASIRESFCANNLESLEFVTDQTRLRLLELKDVYNLKFKNFIGLEFGKYVKRNERITEIRHTFCNPKMLFDSMGYVYPCISTASFPELATLKFIPQKEHINNWWETNNGKNKDECKKCSLYYICGGGCNFEWQERKVYRCKEFIEQNIRFSLNYYMSKKEDLILDCTGSL